MPVIQKKICLLGAFSVGKTSLIQRYVHSLFSDKYHTTVGVKIDKKQLAIAEHNLMLMIWDLAGEDDFTNIRTAHLRGLAGYIIVIDGTRQNSFDVAVRIHQRVQQEIGVLPVVFVLNKVDLREQWVLTQEHIAQLVQLNCPVVQASARLGSGVEESFNNLAQQIIAAHQG